MNIGRMDKRIQLCQFTKTPDGRGGRVSKPELVDTVWAEFRKPQFTTSEENGTVVSHLTREIAIRYRADVRRGWQVLYGPKTFDIEHTYDYGKETTVLVCREVVK